MEVFTQVFRQRQRNGLKEQKHSNETKAGSLKSTQSISMSKKCLANQTKSTNLYFAQLRPQIVNEFLEFDDHYEINLNCLANIFDKDDVTIKYNEIDNQIKIFGVQSKIFGERVIVDRKILRCFNLPNDIDADRITSVMKQNNHLKIRIPKIEKMIIDVNSDGEHDSCYECLEGDESNDAFN